MGLLYLRIGKMHATCAKSAEARVAVGGTPTVWRHATEVEHDSSCLGGMQLDNRWPGHHRCRHTLWWRRSCFTQHKASRNS